MAIVALCSVAAFVVATEWMIHNIEPVLRRRVIETLSDRFDAPVELDSLNISMLKSAGIGLVVEGHGLRIPYTAHGWGAHPAGTLLPHHEPLVRVDSFRFRTTLRGLLHSPTLIERTTVQGVEVIIPPPEQRLTTQGVGRNGLPPDPDHPRTRPRIALVFSHIDCTDAKLLIKGRDVNKEPLEFDIREVHLTHAGQHTAMNYEAVLTNPKPLGLIHAVGHIGPWAGVKIDERPDPSQPPPDPGQTPVDGDFTFDHADLNTIKGIGGTLTGKGHFAGTLDHLQVDGTTETPNFSLDISNHAVPLSTHYDAIVDGTSGDTYLQQVQAHLEHSDFTCTGHVINIKGRGKDILMDVDIPHARMDDMLRLAVKTLPPLMSGTLTMKAKLHIPPGKVSVTEKLEMQGAMHITSVRFTDPKLQDRIDGLSVRATGHPEDVKQASQDRTAEVVSQMQANFTIGHGLISAADVNYRIPGATVLLNGVYSMDGKTFEFKGHAKTEATASEMVGGWKGMLLKPVDRFFKKNGAGLEVPIQISGTGADGVHFGLAMHGANDTPAEIAHDMREDHATKLAQEHQATLMKQADHEDELAARDPSPDGARTHHDRAVALRRQVMAETQALNQHQEAEEAAAKARDARQNR